MKGLCSPVSGPKPRQFPVKLQESPSETQFKIHKWIVALPLKPPLHPLHSGNKGMRECRAKGAVYQPLLCVSQLLQAAKLPTWRR